MKKKISSKLTTYHVMLKVSPSFMRGRLHNHFVSTACPDLFLGLNGPAPDGCVAVFCSSNGAGAAIQHYHIPITDLSWAPPCKKNQECIVLDGSHCGSISTIAKCNLKKNTGYCSYSFYLGNFTFWSDLSCGEVTCYYMIPLPCRSIPLPLQKHPAWQILDDCPPSTHWAPNECALRFPIA
jgi:hypothetical protein